MIAARCFLAVLLFFVPATALNDANGDDEGRGVPFVVLKASASSCDRCIEPYVVPMFYMKVIEGEFPQHGPIRCRGAGRELHCDKGLRMTIEKIAFH